MMTEEEVETDAAAAAPNPIETDHNQSEGSIMMKTTDRLRGIKRPTTDQGMNLKLSDTKCVLKNAKN